MKLMLGSDASGICGEHMRRAYARTVFEHDARTDAPERTNSESTQLEHSSHVSNAGESTAKFLPIGVTR